MTKKVLSIILAVVIAVAIGALGYWIAKTKVEEKFTEFYILGPEGRPGNYPQWLKVGEKGRVILGIVNHEQERASYKVEVWINGEKTKLGIEGKDEDEMKIELEPEQEWEGAVGFVPQTPGEKQKVEFLLYENGKPHSEDQLYLWVDVEEV